MLSKLIGYEFKSTRRIFLPAYGVMLILSLLNAIVLALPNSIINSIEMPFGILMTIYILSIFTVYILSFAYMVHRFNTNLLGDEGYLMFTLPTNPSQLIWSKCITSTIWMCLTILLCGVSLFLLFLPLGITGLIQNGNIDLSFFFYHVHYLFSEFIKEFGINTLFIPLELLAIGIIGTMNFCMHVYACLSVGSLSNKYRLGFAFLAYLGFAVIKQIIFVSLMSIMDIIAPTFQFTLSLDAFANMHIFLIGYLIYTIISLVVNYVITNYILSKHLNLQ